MKRILLAPALIAFLTVSAQASPGEHDLFRLVIDESLKTRTVDALITQFIFQNGATEKYSGRYRADDSGRFRIDYAEPSRQLVVKTRDALHWYFYDGNTMCVINEAARGGGTTANPVRELLAHAGLRFTARYAGTHLSPLFRRVNHFIVEDKANGLRFTIITDAARHVVERKIITDARGYEIVHEHYGDYRLAGPALFPHRVDVFTRTREGVTRNTTRYESVTLNRPLDNGIFTVPRFPGMKVRSIDADGR